MHNVTTGMQQMQFQAAPIPVQGSQMPAVSPGKHIRKIIKTCGPAASESMVWVNLSVWIFSIRGSYNNAHDDDAWQHDVTNDDDAF